MRIEGWPPRLWVRYRYGRLLGWLDGIKRLIGLAILALALTACSYAPAHVAVPRAELSADIGTAIEGGVASWFDSYGPGLYAAVPSYRWGDPRYPIEVCRQDTPSRCVVVEVLDFCACPDRIVDLSRDAFARLEDPSRGLVAVTLSDVPAVVPTPPQTDSE